MKSLLAFLKSLKFIFIPSFWLMMLPYNKAWDKYLNQLLDDYEFDEIGRHTAKIDGVEVWISNYPYSCFNPYEVFSHDMKIRPSRLTIERAYNKLLKCQIKQLQKNENYSR